MSEMLRMQLDDYNPMAPILTPYLLDIEDLPPGYYSDGQALLTTWDFHQPSESRAAAYYNASWRALLRLTFHDELPESQWPDGGARWFAAVEQLLLQPTNPWWDDRTTDDIETRDDILRQAQLDARDELTALLGRDPQTWSWGQLHHLDLRNATLGESGLAPVEWLENREDYQVAGGGSIVNATSWDAAEGYEVTSAPSMRMVVSLADFDDSRWINLTGVSGHPASGHYVDQTQLWVDGETLPWLFSEEAVSGAAGAGLKLVPAPAAQ